MKLRLGMSPISWSNDDLPQLGGETSLQTCLVETPVSYTHLTLPTMELV